MKTTTHILFRSIVVILAASFIHSTCGQSAPLAPQDVPENGTFWSMQNADWPPLPMNWLSDMNLDVYTRGNGSFWVDDRGVDYSAFQDQSDGDQQLSSMGSEEFSGEESYQMYDMSFTSDDLWLEIVSKTNDVATFVIHPPDTELTNGVYDLFDTTNLSADVSGLNVTNWEWLARTSPGQTNLAVSNLTYDAAFFMLARTNDADADTLSDVFEHLVSHSNPNSADSDGDTLPDAWEWNYFGNFLQSTNDDYDGNGNNNLYEYQNGIDPNKIRFSLYVTNSYVNFEPVPVQINVLGGVPSSMAILVDSTNFSSATWQSFTSNAIVSLGVTDGDRGVWIGLRGRRPTSQQTWEWLSLTRDTVPPLVVITNPVMSTVLKPVLQLQGYSSEPLASISYDLTNAALTVSNVEGFVIGQKLDTNTLKFTTNWFQCYDLPLTNGVNAITLRVADLAGNTTTTNFTVTLDYSGATNPPVIAVSWPQSNGVVSGTNFTLQGTLSDDTATVVVSGLGDDVIGIVERDGKFSVPNLPLAATTNVLTIAATNAAGVGQTMQWTVRKSTLTSTIGSVSFGSGTQTHLVTVSGTVSDPSYNVYVNGVQATVNLDGSWTATNVPVSNTTGSVTVNVQIYSSGQGPGNGTPISEQQQQVVSPPTVRASHYEQGIQYEGRTDDACVSGSDTLTETIHWTRGEGGHFNETFYSSIDGGSSGSCQYNVDWPSEWPDGALTGTTDCSGDPFTYNPPVAWEYCSTIQTYNDTYLSDCGGDGHQSYTLERTAKTRIDLVGSGPAQSSQQQLIRLTVSAAQYSTIPNWFLTTPPPAGDLPIPVSAIRILGRALVPTATNADVGELYLVIPAGSTQDVTPTVDYPLVKRLYSFKVDAEEVKWAILANGIDLATNTPEFCVGQAVTNQLVFDPSFPTNVVVTYQWFFSLDYVNTNIPPVDGNHSPTYSKDANLKTNMATKLWWLNGGQKLAGCNVTISNANQPVTLTPHRFVNVYQPTLSNFTNISPSITNAFMWLTDPDPDELSYGDITVGTSGTNGMRWSVNINSKITGKFGVTQLFQARYHIELAPYDVFNSLGQDSVDNEEWYDGHVFTYATNTPSSQIYRFSDNPSVSVPGAGALIDIALAEDYIRFKPGLPDNDGNIYVTLGTVEWNANGAYNRVTGWSTNSTPPASSPTNSIEFPTWSSGVHSSGN